MTHYNKITLENIKNFFENYSIKISTEISDSEVFFGLSSLKNAKENDISFFNDNNLLSALKKTKAKACFLNKEYSYLLPSNCKSIIVDNPYLSFACLTNLFHKEEKSNGIISNNTYIEKGAHISNNVQIDSFVSILDKTKIGENVKIGHNCTIGKNVDISNGTIVESNTILSNCVIGAKCIIKSGSVIGRKGFGFEEKTKMSIQHFGNVVIGNNSYIGSNTTIDRAVFDSTKIGEFSHIDNLVQIAHNVEIGKHAIIAAQAGIAGSTSIGDFLKVGGQAGISGHLRIGNNVTIAAKSGVTKNLTNNSVVAGFPAIDIKKWKLNTIKFNKE